MSTLRKNITITEEENEIILDFCKKIGKSFSEVLRMGALFYIKEVEKKDLAEFLSLHCESVNLEEQKEFEKIIKKIDNNGEGKEINLDELLSDKI